MESIMESIRKNPGLYLTEGILFIILGTLSIIMPIISTIALGFILGWVLVIGGIYRLFRSIKLRNELRHFWLSLLTSIVAVVIGFSFLNHILAGLYLFTIALAAYFTIDGIVLIVQSMAAHDNKNWGLILFGGILNLLLAVLIISGMPYAAAWVPGLLLGINLLFAGFTLTYTAANAGTPAQRYGT